MQRGDGKQAPFDPVGWLGPHLRLFIRSSMHFQSQQTFETHKKNQRPFGTEAQPKNKQRDPDLQGPQVVIVPTLDLIKCHCECFFMYPPP